jgi:histidinol-phosphatase
MHAWRAELEFALWATREAGSSTLPAFRAATRSSDVKADGSLVTKTDRSTELLLRDMCAQAYPEDGFLGEEFGETPSASGRRWIADPIDGTISFVHGVPLYGTLLALESENMSRVGVIHMPALHETVYAADGMGAWHLPAGELTPSPARMRPCSSLSDAVACATSPDYFNSPQLRAVLLRILDAVGVTRGWSDCYAHVLAATGRVDVVVEPGVKPWDVAPMTVIMREAGGLCTDWNGQECAHNGTALVTAGTLHDSMMQLLNT